MAEHYCNSAAISVASFHLKEVVHREAGAVLVLCVQPGSEQLVPVPVLQDVANGGLRVPVVGHGRRHPRHHGVHVRGEQGREKKVRQLRRRHHGESAMESSYDSHLTDTDEMSNLTCSMQLRVILSMWKLMLSSPLLTIISSTEINNFGRKKKHKA